MSEICQIYTLYILVSERILQGAYKLLRVIRSFSPFLASLLPISLLLISPLTLGHVVHIQSLNFKIPNAHSINPR